MRRFLSWLTLLLATAASAHHGSHQAEATNASQLAVSSKGATQTAFGGGATGQASALHWTTAPVLLPARTARGERNQAVLQLAGIAANAIEVYAADGPADRRKVSYSVTDGRAQIESATPKTGNYHWVVAREEHADEVRVASTAWYFSNPGASPKELLQTPKHELEIVPEPLPREHASYRESEKWRFFVRFQGKPLADTALVLETEFGTRTSFLTDRHGYATVLFPRDFRPAKGEGRNNHGPRRANFALSVAHAADGRRYFTAFNHFYGEDPERTRSLAWGASFLFVGMIAGAPLLRRKRETLRRKERHG